MSLGEKIRKIRNFRGLTQRDFGLMLGYEDKNADVRVAQYESGYRVPKKDRRILRMENQLARFQQLG